MIDIVQKIYESTDADIRISQHAPKYDDEGYVYRQTIKISLDEEKCQEIIDILNKNTKNTKIHFGINYLSLNQLYYIIDNAEKLFGRRLGKVLDKNTILNIVPNPTK